MPQQLGNAAPAKLALIFSSTIQRLSVTVSADPCCFSELADWSVVDYLACKIISFGFKSEQMESLH